MRTNTASPLPTTLLDEVRAGSALAGSAQAVMELAQVPHPLRDLLGQEGGMTAALERHWGEPMLLRVLRSLRIATRLRREVVLLGARRGLPAELGLIEIRLDALPSAVAAAVTDGVRPFGTLLAEAGLHFRSRPTRYIQVTADTVLAATLAVPRGTVLFGRETRLTAESGRLLAEAVEVLSGPCPADA